MKKIFVLLSVLMLATSLFSCRNYSARDGKYNYYNERERRTVGERIDEGIDMTERGIRRGFQSAENGFERVTGIE